MNTNASKESHRVWPLTFLLVGNSFLLYIRPNYMCWTAPRPEDCFYAQTRVTEEELLQHDCGRSASVTLPGFGLGVENHNQGKENVFWRVCESPF